MSVVYACFLKTQFGDDPNDNSWNMNRMAETEEERDAFVEYAKYRIAEDAKLGMKIVAYDVHGLAK